MSFSLVNSALVIFDAGDPTFSSQVFLRNVYDWNLTELHSDEDFFVPQNQLILLVQ